MIGYEENGELKGYMVIEFLRQHQLKSNLRVRELVYNSPAALWAFSDFLHRQGDQFEKIIIDTQDETLQFVLDDLARHTYDTFESRNIETCTVGLGLMYRVVDVAGLFTAMAGYQFDVPDMMLKLTIVDDFLPENNGSTVIRLADGHASVTDQGPWDVDPAIFVVAP